MQSPSSSESLASSDPAYKQEADKEEAGQEETVQEETGKEESFKEETYKEEKESDAAENDLAQEDTTPVGKSAEIVEIPDPVLKKVIQDTLGIGDREITKSDALLLTQLEYDGYDNEKKEHKD